MSMHTPHPIPEETVDEKILIRIKTAIKHGDNSAGDLETAIILFPNLVEEVLFLRDRRSIDNFSEGMGR